MNFERRDFAKLRWPLLAALAMIAAAVAVAWWSDLVGHKARLERDAAAQAKAQVEQRLRQVRTEEQDIKTRTQQFLDLEHAGITGPEKRLDWTEQLRDLQHQLRLPAMSYELGPQVALESVSGNAYAFYSSPLNIQLRLLHEEDLLNFLNRLQREAKAMVLVRSCRVSRLPPAGGNDATQLGAECTMELVTLQRSTGRWQP